MDKQIHRDELRLRVLVTDDCNRGCPYCLNDFQAKPDSSFQAKYIDPLVVYQAVESYVQFCEEKGLFPTISISGGEPGMHPRIKQIVDFSRTTHGCLQLNTNGLALKVLPKEQLKKIDSLRVHVHRYSEATMYTLREYRGQAVFVFQDIHYREVSHRLALVRQIGLYTSHGVPVKVFSDFNGSEDHYRAYESFVKEIQESQESHSDCNAEIIGRFTGVQENRGPGCDSCDKNCVTLKALWVHPDGRCTACARGGTRHPLTQAYLPSEWDTVLRHAYEFHKVG